jgi:hypothetical protein
LYRRIHPINKGIKEPKNHSSFFKDFLTPVDSMNSDVITVTTEKATKYLAEAIPKTFPNVNLMPTTANEVTSKINSLKNIFVVMVKYQQCYSNSAHTTLIIS